LKFCDFLAIFPTKTWHNFAVVQATSIKVGFKVIYNSYIWATLKIQWVLVRRY
jgi:hypothetical protein